MSTIEQLGQPSAEDEQLEALFMRDYRPRTPEDVQRDRVANLLVARDMALLEQLAAVNAL